MLTEQITAAQIHKEFKEALNTNSINPIAKASSIDKEYYETLKDSVDALRMLIIESIDSTLDSRINLLNETDQLTSVHRGVFRKKQTYIPLGCNY